MKGRVNIQTKIDDFIKVLKATKTKKNRINLCKAEIKTLEKYEPTTQKRYISRYRNAIRNLGKTYQYLLNTIWMDASKINDKYQSDIDELGDAPLIIKASKIDYFLKKSADQMVSKTFSKTMQGLSLASGRRNSELLKTANFHKLSDIDLAIETAKKITKPHLLNTKKDIKKQLEILGLNAENCLLFSRQLKSNKDSKDACKEPYVVPILTDIDLFLKRFNWLRINYPEYQDMTIEEINSRTNSQLNNASTGVKNVKNYGLDFPRKHCEFKTLRKLYAAIAAHQCTTYILPERLFSRILGHAKGSGKTAASYRYVRIL